MQILVLSPKGLGGSGLPEPFQVGFKPSYATETALIAPVSAFMMCPFLPSWISWQLLILMTMISFWTDLGGWEHCLPMTLLF